MRYNKLFQYIAEHTDKSIHKVFVECKISSQTLYSMKNPGKKMYGHVTGGSVSLSVIDRLCEYLCCQPCDIMELETEA